MGGGGVRVCKNTIFKSSEGFILDKNFPFKGLGLGGHETRPALWFITMTPKWRLAASLLTWCIWVVGILRRHWYVIWWCIWIGVLRRRWYASLWWNYFGTITTWVLFTHHVKLSTHFKRLLLANCRTNKRLPLSCGILPLVSVMRGGDIKSNLLKINLTQIWPCHGQAFLVNILCHPI